MIGVKQLAGRDYTDADEGNRVTIVNQSFVKQYWPDLKQSGDAVGRRIRPGSDTPWRDHRGVVGDEKPTE
ncbi:MAG: hypothetical protein QM757_46495 [Paludibaculum sp.]